MEPSKITSPQTFRKTAVDKNDTSRKPSLRISFAPINHQEQLPENSALELSHGIAASTSIRALHNKPQAKRRSYDQAADLLTQVESLRASCEQSSKRKYSEEISEGLTRSKNKRVKVLEDEVANIKEKLKEDGITLTGLAQGHNALYDLTRGLVELIQQAAENNATLHRNIAAIFSNASSKDSKIARLIEKVELLEQGRIVTAEQYAIVQTEQQTQARKLAILNEEQGCTINDMQAKIQELEVNKHALTREVAQGMETNVALSDQVDQLRSDAQAQEKSFAKFEARVASDKKATDDVLRNVLEITRMLKEGYDRLQTDDELCD